MNTKKWFLLFAIFALFNFQAFPQVKNGISKIVIDAGHGGEDPGAVGSKCKEKDITLAVALEVGKLISENCPDVNVAYTRKTDVFIPLYNRSKIANDKHADLFISIHCNSSDNKSANGVETFVMGLHKTESSLDVARKENAAMLLEKDYKNKYGDFNPNSPESYVIFSIYSSAYLESSVQLASKVQKNLLKCSQFRDRQVQQAGFWVLHKVAMPSILIELGFVSNKAEEAKLIDPTFQKALAASICNAFIEYKNQVEGNSIAPVAVPETKPQPKTEDSTPAKEEEKPAVTEKPELKPVDEPATPNVETGVVFKVQIFALPDKLNPKDPKFAGLKDVGNYFEGNLWKYTVGSEKKFADIQTVLKTAKEKFPDAFIIAFKDGKKIPVSEARKLTE